MEPPPTSLGPFDRFGPLMPTTPLVIAIPHAGRDYPPALLDNSLLPEAMLAKLEDRFADRLAAGAPALGATLFIARRARAWIDLNRDERELDSAMIVPPPHSDRLIASVKVRGGLGLIPRRIGGSGEILRRRLPEADVAARIESDHRPWHAAIAAALAAARARFGIALLIDLHSMPPIEPNEPDEAPQIVIGDRHGRSCHPRFTERLTVEAAASGLSVSRNLPYAGGHTLDRHGRPKAGLHAVQIELDRSLYLAADLRAPGPGLMATAALVTRLAAAMLDELGARMLPDTLAAE
jgi:N-formylglutamate amidohydrolase